MRVTAVVIIMLVCLIAPPVHADNESLRVVLHINDGFKLGHLRNSVKNIKNELGRDADIKVVVNGKAVKRLLRSNIESTKIIQSILEKKVPVGICHNALANNKIKKEMLIDGVEVLPTDGNVTVIKYQQQGYIYVKL